MLTFPRAIVLGLLQGVTELFPISSSGHLVVVPAWLGWDDLVSNQKSFYLAFIVAIHVATALALLVYFREEWVRIIGGLFRTLRTRQISTPDERMAWLLVIATIPAGIAGVLLQGPLEDVFASPFAIACLLTVNGAFLFVAELIRRGAAVRRLAHQHATKGSSDARRLDTFEFKDAAVVGTTQMIALLPGISRSGTTMVGGLLRGLDHQDAARFSFLLATPVIFGAGLYEAPVLARTHGAWGPILVGAVLAGLAAYATVRFLFRFYKRHSLVPFAAYCLVAGTLSIFRFR